MAKTEKVSLLIVSAFIILLFVFVKGNDTGRAIVLLLFLAAWLPQKFNPWFHLGRWSKKIL